MDTEKRPRCIKCGQRRAMKFMQQVSAASLWRRVAKYKCVTCQDAKPGRPVTVR
jgi:nitrate/TMAO reductase-like tetraheme cytochrome c subunit